MNSQESSLQPEVPLDLDEPTSGDNLPPYTVTFKRCIDFSRWFQPSTDLCQLRPLKRSSRSLTKEVARGLAAVGLKREHFDGAPGQALKWSAMLAPAIAQAVGVRAWPTIGQLWVGSSRIFGFTWEQLKELLQSGVHADRVAAMGLKSLNWHAWVTLETGQIVDLTFPSTLARHAPQQFAEFAGAILCGLESELIRKHRYFPMVSGNAALQRLQERSSMALLGRDLDDLLKYSVAPVGRAVG